jgi:hypothetical protein
MSAYVARFNGDLSAFICAGSEAAGRWPFEHVHTSLSQKGFDGQYYYAIAQNPWQRHDEQVVIHPGYRHQRIVYPAVSWALSMGDPRRLLWVMPLVNLLAIAAISGLGGYVAQRLGRSAWWGLLLPVAIGANAPAMRTMTDPVSSLAALTLMAAWLLNARSGTLFVCGLMAALSREQNITIVGIIALLSFWKEQWARVGGMVAVITIWMMWILTLRLTYGQMPFVSDNLGWPRLEGWLWHFTRFGVDRATTMKAIVNCMALSFLLVQVGLAVSMPCFRAEPLVTLTGLAGAAFVLGTSPEILSNAHNYLRVFAFLPLSIWLWSMHSGRNWPALLLSPMAAWPCYVVLQAWRG